MKAKAAVHSPESPFDLALRIRHPSMDPADVSRELGLAPTHSFRAGQPRSSPSDSPASSVHAESYWLGTLDPTSWPSDAWLSGFANLELTGQKLDKAASSSLGLALAMITRRLVRTHAALFERIRAEGGEVDLLVSLSPLAVGSFSLTPEVSRVFGDLGITIDFAITGE